MFRYFTACFFLIFLAQGVLPSSAASIQISPPGLDVTGAAMGSISLQNLGGEAVKIQARIFKWIQDSKGEDVLVATKDAIISPSSSILQPGASYTFRIGRMGEPHPDRQLSYRVLFDEIPNANVRRAGAQIGFAMRYNVPVFFGNKNDAPAINWSFRQDGNDIIIAARNVGTRHTKLSDIKLAAGKGQLIVTKGSAGYLLPGAERHWTVRDSKRVLATNKSIRILANSSDYPINEVIPQ